MTDNFSIAELTLDELRPLLAAALPAHAAFDGWNESALAAAAADIGADPDVARLAFPGGALEMIDAWTAQIDAALATRFTADELAAMKVRTRISSLLRARIELAAPHREAARRALAVLALPQNVAAATRMLWRTCDGIWRLAGDTATDFNHYTKRIMLGGVYTATLLYWLDDDSEDEAATWAFLDRRIDNVMQIEKAKAQWRSRADQRPSLARFFGRLRYPVT